MHPIFIAGAAVIGLPILLHILLRQQPKKLVFPALRFLKQRQKTNQRRVQLKHILLLLLRCLLLALFALALFQPTLNTGNLKNPFGDEPVAAVIVIDTSPSMGYRAAGTSRLDEARRRANELLNELPPNSKVAILPSHDPSGTWQPTALEARQQIEALREPSGSAQPLGPAIRAAYDLLATVDQDNPEGAEPLVKLIAVFGDGTTGSWDAKDVSGLVAKRNALPTPPTHVFFNVGVEKHENLAVTELKMDTDRLSGAADAVVTAMVRADGMRIDGLPVVAQLDDGPTEVVTLTLAQDQTLPAVFTFRKPKAGFHTVRVKIDRANEDALPFDNERWFTFEVQPKRNILAISDRPEFVKFWRDSHNFGTQEFDCTVVTPDAAATTPLAQYEMVAVIAVADPKPFAGKLTEYVQGGGKLLLAPDGPGSDADENRAPNYAALGELLPAPLDKVASFPNPTKTDFGVPWKMDEESDLRHKMFAPIRDWQKQGGIDIFKTPRRVEKYRQLGRSDATVVVKYADPNVTPAVVERAVGKGDVLLLTTRIDDDSQNPNDHWNDYWTTDHSWSVVFPWLVARYLCDLGTEVSGSEAGGKRRFNFATGAEVPVPVRGFTPNGERRIRLEGPGVAAGKSKFTLPADVTALTLRDKPPADARTTQPDVWELEGEPLLTQGAFALNPDGVESPWRFAFSLAVPPSESDLQLVPVDALGELFAKENVVPLGQKSSIADYLQTRKNSNFDLFPVLVILVLIFFAFEGIMANRFYKLK